MTPMKWKKYECSIRRLRSVSAGVEAPSQLILVLYLMMRGLVTLPWQQSVAASCLEDSLGRVACLPSLPLASLTFSIVAIIKATYDLNIDPIVEALQQTSLHQCKSRCELGKVLKESQRFKTFPYFKNSCNSRMIQARTLLVA